MGLMHLLIKITPGDLVVTIKLDEQEQALTIGDIKKRIIAAIQTKGYIVSEQLDLDKLQLTNLPGEDDKVIARELLEDRFILTLRCKTKITRVESHEEQVARNVSIEPLDEKNFTDQLEKIKAEFLAENDSLIGGFAQIDFDIKDDAERLEAEFDEKKKLINLWQINISRILAPLLQNNSDTNKVELWKWFATVLQDFADRHPDQKLGLIFLESDKPDHELVNVIEMMVGHSGKKNKTYLVLPEFLIKQLALAPTSNSVKCETKIDNLNFLHHWSTIQARTRLPERINATITIIQKIPNINTVVLRGCYSAGDIERYMKGGQTNFDKKQIMVISKEKNLEKLNVRVHDFLFQQHVQNMSGVHVVKTRVKYLDPISGEAVIKELQNIPLNTAGPKLTPEVERALAFSAYANDLPPLVYHFADLHQQLKKVRQDWLLNKPLTSQEENQLKQALKAADVSARTFEVTSFPSEASYAAALAERMNKEKIPAVIKSYVTTYQGFRAGALGESSHGHLEIPKAFIIKKQ